MKPLPALNTHSRFAGSGLLLFLLRALPAAAVLLVMLFYARRLPEAVYGEYQMFWVRYSVLSTFTVLGLPAVLPLFSPGQLTGSLQKLKPTHTLLFIGVNLAAAGLFAWWEVPVFPDAVYLAPLFLLAWTLGLILEAALITYQKLRALLVINILFAIAFYGLHVVALPVDKDFLKNLFAALTGLAALRAVVFFFLFRAARQIHPPAQGVPVKSIWLHLTLTDMLQQSARYLDKLLVGFLTHPTGAAIYFNGAQEVPFLSALLGAASGNFLLHAARDGESEMARKARWLRFSGALLGALVFPLFWGLFFFREALFEVVFAGKYAFSVPVFAVFLCALPFRAYPFSALLQHLRKGRLITIGAALDLVLALALCLALFPSWGGRGLAFSFVGATAFLAVFYTIATMRITRLSVTELFPLRTWALLFFGSALALKGLQYLAEIQHWPPLPALLTAGCVMTFLGAAGLYFVVRRKP